MMTFQFPERGEPLIHDIYMNGDQHWVQWGNIKRTVTAEMHVEGDRVYGIRWLGERRGWAKTRRELFWTGDGWSTHMPKPILIERMADEFFTLGYVNSGIGELTYSDTLTLQRVVANRTYGESGSADDAAADAQCVHDSYCEAVRGNGDVPPYGPGYVVEPDGDGGWL